MFWGLVVYGLSVGVVVVTGLVFIFGLAPIVIDRFRRRDAFKGNWEFAMYLWVVPTGGVIASLLLWAAQKIGFFQASRLTGSDWFVVIFFTLVGIVASVAALIKAENWFQERYERRVKSLLTIY